MVYVSKMIYSDTHLHVNPVKGLGAEKIAKRFKQRNGWFMAIVALPPYHYGFTEPSIGSYWKTIELLNKEALKAREQGLEICRFIGIHPAEIDYYYRQGIKPDKLIQLINDVLGLIEKAIRENLVDGIGEIGRQHYGTSPERIVFSEIVMVKAMILGRDYDVPIQLHLEQGGFISAYSVKLLGEITGLDLGNVIIHHVNRETAVWADEFSIPFTIPIRYFDEKYAVSTWKNAMFESDFLDDPTRPGVSAYPWEIPDKIRGYVEMNLMNEEYAYRLLVDNVVKYFKVKHP